MGAIIQTKVDVRGLADLGKALEELGSAVEKRVLGRALKWASAGVLGLAKEKAPRGSGTKKNARGQNIGHMAESLIVEQRKTKAGEIKDTIGSATHGPLLHLVEFGTAPHYQPGQSRQHPGAAAQPFMRPAIDEGGGPAIANFATALEAGVKVETTRAARRAELALKRGRR